MSKVLGVLGGMGPGATLDFLGKVQAYTPAKKDQDHIRVIADINPHLPDRSDPFAKPGPMLAEMAGALRGAGAEVLAIPSNGAHEFADLISRASGLPLIDMITLAARAARDTGARRVGVLSLKATTKIYHEYLAAQGLGLVTLSAPAQTLLLDLIRKIKGGEKGTEVQSGMEDLVRSLIADGAETVIVGCVEAPWVLNTDDYRQPLIDPIDLLARHSVAVCLGMEPVPVFEG